MVQNSHPIPLCLTIPNWTLKLGTYFELRFVISVFFLALLSSSTCSGVLSHTGGLKERLLNMFYLQLPLFDDLKWPALGKWAWIPRSSRKSWKSNPLRITVVSHTLMSIPGRNEVWDMIQGTVRESFCKHRLRSFCPSLLLRNKLSTKENKNECLHFYFIHIPFSSLFYDQIFEYSSN